MENWPPMTGHWIRRFSILSRTASFRYMAGQLAESWEFTRVATYRHYAKVPLAKSPAMDANRPDDVVVFTIAGCAASVKR